MSIADKFLFQVGGSVKEPWHSVLSASGWQVMHIPDVQRLAGVRHVGNATAGLIYVDEQLLPRLTKLAPHFAKHDLAWILLVEQRLVGSPAVARFIDEFCYDYHSLPVNPGVLIVTLGRAHGMVTLHRSQQASEDEVQSEIIGEHPSIQRIRRDIRKIAPTDVNVLISGESGTGKELIARALHQQSPRADASFIAVNCGSLPANLVQSELFGHERGAFTGASEKRIGRIEAANKGTLFLDEIGDMTFDTQVNLLRFLQEGIIDRVGGNTPIAVNARVISATHVDLPKAIALGRFREDLFYRLNVCRLHLPPLRERHSDILPIAHYLLDFHAGRLGVPRKRLSTEAGRAMVSYSWPGNVRELTNRICQGLVMASTRNIKPQDMGLNPSAPFEGRTLEKVRKEAERDAVRMALALHNGSNVKAAQELGVSRATFYRLMQRHLGVPLPAEAGDALDVPHEGGETGEGAGP
ncbi:sigma-54 dependent transcriptional regulator [Jeongeupia naejangsanensis]|uniref:Sigma-54-dependent Fis family transcriptional regulator n=1 Tax=Jeongeupia naejangsanensis TaxID=613195 RepID=A0ABS2BPK8_9NEIS|nr:sigma-54 dependent transcriptional regulator [Jeongeupia naejangsanensis]MBM3117557.1 sigma-54-dependent Fis family transcriptional regulator [Jeongeupia naejangsanensis]